MLNRQIVRSRTNQYYVFHTRLCPDRPRNQRPRDFLDQTFAEQFVRGFNSRVKSRFWVNLASKLTDFSQWQQNSRREPIDKYVAKRLVSGHIQAFEIEDYDNLVKGSKQKRIPTKTGMAYRFAPAAIQLVSRVDKVKQFSNTAEAEAFLKTLNLETEQLDELSKTLELPTTPGTATSKADSKANDKSNDKALIAPISQALVNGDIIVTEEPPSSPPKSEASRETSQALTGKTAQQIAAGASAMGATDTAKAAAIAQQLSQARTPTCNLSKLIVSCNHNGRKAEADAQTKSTPTLSVVASETDKKGFDIIKAKLETDDPCSYHQSSSSSIQPMPAKTIKGSLENTYHLASAPIANPIKVLWLPSIKPRAYKISANACDRFEQSAIAVNVYPDIAWDASVGYAFGGRKSSRGKDKNGIAKNTHEDTAGKFTGKFELNYDGKKEDLTADYKNGIDEVLTKLDWITQKIDEFFAKLGENSAVSLEPSWPDIQIKYSAALKEDKNNNEVMSSYALSVAATPLIGLKGSIDAFPILLAAAKANPLGHPVASIMEAAQKGIGNDSTPVSLKGEIKLEFSIDTKVGIDFSTTGENGRDKKETRSESAIDMLFQLEGTVGVKGHAWIVQFEKNYKAGMRSGFVGKVIIERDDVGYYWYTRFLFNGLTVYFTEYEKVKTKLTAEQLALKRMGKLPDEMSQSTTKEFTWLEPEADTEAPTDTDTAAGSAATQSSNRHYLIRF